MSGANSGKRWTVEDDAKIMSMSKNGKSISDIAKALERTPAAVRARIASNITSMVSNGASVENLCAVHHMPVEEIKRQQEAVARFEQELLSLSLNAGAASRNAEAASRSAGSAAIAAHNAALKASNALGSAESAVTRANLAAECAEVSTARANESAEAARAASGRADESAEAARAALTALNAELEKSAAVREMMLKTLEQKANNNVQCTCITSKISPHKKSRCALGKALGVV